MVASVIVNKMMFVGGNSSEGNTMRLVVLGGLTKPDPTPFAGFAVLWVPGAPDTPEYVYGPLQPTTALEGLVWIEAKYTGIAIDGFGTEQWMIPINAPKVYTGSEWIRPDAEIFINGIWNNFKFFLLQGGLENVPWSRGADSQQGSATGVSAQYVNTGSGILISINEPTPGNYVVSGVTTNKFDLTIKNTLNAVIADYSSSGAGSIQWGVYSSRNVVGAVGQIQNRVVGGVIAGNGELSLDVSNVVGSYYIGFYCWTNNISYKQIFITSVWVS